MPGTILRFITAGSVDDGKSTLIGRLLVDTKSLRSDQIDAVRSFNSQRGRSGLDLALFTDGLKAEREQGITIDVAYRYFATAKRKFIMADAPGHLHFTRNMVTGASTADLAVVLVDVRMGLQEQTRRHSFIAALLGIPEIVLCVNKMDLVEFGEVPFQNVIREFGAFVAGLGFERVHYIPISALNGDNVVEPSGNMPWYRGHTLLQHLEKAEVGIRGNKSPRFPAQYVIRENLSDGKQQTIMAGRVEGGSFAVGDQVLLLPSNKKTFIRSIHSGSKNLKHAHYPHSVTIMLVDQLELHRGDLLVSPLDLPKSSKKIELVVCWLGDHPVKSGSRFLVQHVTGEYSGVLTNLRDRIDLSTLNTEPCDKLHPNDIAEATLELSGTMTFDPYSENRTMGSVILVDEQTYETVGAGIIR